jgi:hypothetical protein
MKKDFPLRAEFIEWLKNAQALSDGSAKSYCSYVAGVNSLLVGKHAKTSIFKILQILKDVGDFSGHQTILQEAHETLSAINADKAFERPQNTLKNYRAGIKQYSEFLSEYYSDRKDKFVLPEKEQTDRKRTKNTRFELSPDDSVADSFNAFYTKCYSAKNVCDNFFFRIITQDRKYKDISFPIHFLKRLFYCQNNKAFFNKWTNSLIAKTKVIIGKEKHVNLSEVERVIIKDNKLWIATNVQDCVEVFSPKATGKGLASFNIKRFSDVSLDHEKPLYDILHDNINKLTVLKTIHRKLNEKATVANRKKIINAMLKSSFAKKLDLDGLKEELNLIASKTELRLMDRRENISKGKK